MQKDHNEFMRLKAWLFKHQVPIWGEGVAECLFFYPNCLGYVEECLGIKTRRRYRLLFARGNESENNLIKQGDSSHETCRFYGWGAGFQNLKS
jgi:hypothetical protein